MGDHEELMAKEKLKLIQVLSNPLTPNFKINKSQIQNLMQVQSYEKIGVDQASTVSQEGESSCNKNEDKQQKPKWKQIIQKSYIKRVNIKKKLSSSREQIHNTNKTDDSQADCEEGKGMRQNESEIRSEMDIDALLLDSKQEKEKDISFERWRQNSNAVINRNNEENSIRAPVRIGTINQRTPAPCDYLHPSLYKSNTGNRQKYAKLKTNEAIRSQREPVNANIMRNISDLTACSKFISPVLKNKKFVRFSTK